MKRHLNLIPLSLRKRQLLIGQLRRWAVLGGPAAVLGGVLLNTQRAKLTRLKVHVQSLDRRCENVRAVAAQSAAAQQEIRLHREQSRWLRSLEQSDVPLTALAAISQSTGALTGRVQLDRMQFETMQLPHDPAAKQPPAAAGAEKPHVPEPVAVYDRIDLSGSALNDAAISALQAELEATGLFDDVELVGLQAHGQQGRQFQMQCMLHRDFEQLAPLVIPRTTNDETTKAATAAVTQPRTAH